MMKKLLFCLLLISLTFLLISGTACGNEEISVSFDKTEYTLAVGESITLELQGNAKGKKIIWYTSNKSVVSVEDGKLTALSVGTAEIRATISSGEASCIVNAVPNDKQQDNSDVVYSVRLNHNRLEIQPGNQAVLNASVYKNGSLSTENVEWIISDTAVLDKIINGNSITIVGAGTGNCDVIAKIGKATAICKVNVDYKYDFILEGDSAVLTVSGEPYQIVGKAYINGELDNSPAIQWNSDDSTVASVNSNGLVTPVGIGKTTIKALYHGKELTFEIKVKKIVSISSKEEFLAMGQSQSEFSNYVLTTDLTLANEDYTRVDCVLGTESATWDRIAYLVESLNSVFDGQGHTISVTYDKEVLAGIDGKVEAYPALFHTITADGVLRNVKIVSYTITNFETTSVARWNYGLVENCYIDATHILWHESTHVYGPELRDWFQSNTGEIVANYGTVKNCVFKIMTGHMDGSQYKCSYAVRHTYDGGKFENCSVIGRDATYQFISTDYENLAYFGNNPALTLANKDAIRDNCYVFASVSDLLSGNGGKYNADGTITAGTYADVKNLYSEAYWTAVEFVNYTVTVVSNNAEYGTVSPASVTVPYGTEITINGATLTIGGTVITATPAASTADYIYAFTGFTGTTATVTSNMEITANFIQAVGKCAVTFDTNGGSSIAATEYDFGTLTSTLPEAKKAGSTFLYWTLSNGDPLPETITNDITVKAVWGIGTATTLYIANKADFLAMGQGYHAKELPFITYALTTDLVFSTGDFTYNSYGDPDFIGFYETPKTGYLVRNLDCVFDGQGHTITTDYQKGVDWEDTGVTSGFTVMFREIGAKGVLRNLKVVATTDSGWGESSVTKDNRGLIENCYITASHTYQYGWESWMCFCNTAEIIYNYGTVRNCVFNLYTYHSGEGVTGLTNYAVRYTFAGGRIENCTVIGSSGHNISSNNGNWDTAANSDDKRDNCYVFASVSDLLSGNGYKYKADGTVTAGTYTGVKKLYTGTYWTAWLNS